MEEPQTNYADILETLSKAIAPVMEAFQQIGTTIATAVASAIMAMEDGYYYRRDISPDYDPSRIVRGSLASEEVKLLPERAESLH